MASDKKRKKRTSKKKGGRTQKKRPLLEVPDVGDDPDTLSVSLLGGTSQERDADLMRRFQDALMHIWERLPDPEDLSMGKEELDASQIQEDMAAVLYYSQKCVQRALMPEEERARSSGEASQAEIMNEETTVSGLVDS